MESSIAGIIFTQKINRSLYETTISILNKKVGGYVENIFIYGAKSISLLLCVHLDTKSE